MYKFKTLNKEEIVENFKTAIKSTVKSISGKDDLEVSFGNKDIQTEKNLIKLPEIEYFNTQVYKMNLNQFSKLLTNRCFFR